MPDILLTLASAKPHLGLQRLHVGEWESFVDVRGGIAVQFAHSANRLITRILVMREGRVQTTLLAGDTVVELRDVLRRVATSVN